MHKIIRILSFAICINISFAQTYTISGYIKDAKNGESILGATVGAIGTAKGCTSNPYGFYSLSLAAGKYSIKYSLLLLKLLLPSKLSLRLVCFTSSNKGYLQ